VSDDDAEVVGRCRAGDQRAYRELIHRYQARVYSVALRMMRSAEDAEDLTQETFVRVFRAIDRYDPSRPFAAWVLTIVSRLCIDHIRRKRIPTLPMVQRDPGSDEERTLDIADAGPGPEDLSVHDEEEQHVRTLIDSLPPHYRIVVMLRHQQDFSYEEIATALELPLGTVKARIHRARALLKGRIGGGA